MDVLNLLNVFVHLINKNLIQSNNCTLQLSQSISDFNATAGVMQ